MALFLFAAITVCGQKHISREILRRRAVNWIADCRLLAALCLAEFIVWRTLRRQHKERSQRLKHIRLMAPRAVEALANRKH